MNFVSKPKIVNGVYSWPGIKVQKDPVKSWGLYATKDIASGFCLPYGGVPISKSKSDNLLSHSRRLRVDGTCNDKANYLIAANELNTDIIDGHPDKYNQLYPNGAKNAWIGTYCNEPSENEQANCELIYLPLNKAHLVPDYPFIDKSNVVLIHVVNDVNKGEELMIKYGWGNNRYLSLNYTPGNDVYEYKNKISPVVSKCKMRSIKQKSLDMQKIRALNESKKKRKKQRRT